MNNAQPIFDTATRYRLELQGRIDLEWLQSFDSSVEIILAETGRREDVTVINVQTDQAGIVGLVRRLHGLGITILQLHIINDGK